MVKHYFVRENIFFLSTLLLCTIVLFHFLFPFGLGITFAFLLEPLVEKIIAFFDLKKPSWKWLISLGLILAVLFFTFGPVLTIITRSIQELVSVLSSFQSPTQGQDLMLLFAEKANGFFHNFGMDVAIDDIVLKTTHVLKDISQTLLVDLGNILYSTPKFILKFVVFFLSWIFFLVNGKSWRNRFLKQVFPWEQERVLIGETCTAVLKALIVSNILVALIQAFLITICLVIFGTPRFILLGMLAFFMSFIPIIGTAPLMLSVGAWFYFSQSRPLAALGIIICAGFISLLDNILRPYFMKGGAEIQFFWIFLAIICGVSVFGVPGAVIGPVAFALFSAALKTLELTNETKN
jgi:predicted PurR-regulated permease PerM